MCYAVLSTLHSLYHQIAKSPHPDTPYQVQTLETLDGCRSTSITAAVQASRQAAATAKAQRTAARRKRQRQYSSNTLQLTAVYLQLQAQAKGSLGTALCAAEAHQTHRACAMLQQRAYASKTSEGPLAAPPPPRPARASHCSTKRSSWPRVAAHCHSHHPQGSTANKSAPPRYPLKLRLPRPPQTLTIHEREARFGFQTVETTYLLIFLVILQHS